MSTSVLWLSDLRGDHAAVTGGKAARLGDLLAGGFPVPPGFVIPAPACARAIESLGLRAELRRLRDAHPDEVETLSSAVRSRIAGANLDAALVRDIAEAHARLLEGRPALLCVVRSSATAEDMSGASFAGQHATYSHVGADRLLEMVRLCWASLFTVAAVRYRAAHGIDEAAVAMAVVVQEMVASEVSGVAFTVNPLTGAPDELVVEASWGMGAAIVDGRVTPDRWVLARDGLRLREQRIAEKRFMLPAEVGEGEEPRFREVPPPDRRREALTPDLLTQVARLSLAAEARFGAAQDVEWAVSGGRVHLLQSRPVTVAGREEIGRGVTGRWVLFKPVVENFTDPLTPLSQDMFELARPPGMRFVRGWIYMDVDFLRRLLPLRVSPEELGAFLYAFSRGDHPWPLSLARLPGAILGALGLYLVFAVLLLRTRRLPDDALAGYRDLCRRVEDDPSLGPREAFQRLFVEARVLDPIAHLAILVNLSALRFVPWMLVLRRLVRRFAPDLRADAEAILGSGSEGVLSAEMGRGIWALARKAREEPAVRAILQAAPPERALGALLLEPLARGFLDDLFHFLAVNGHRALKEFELRSMRWEEDPSPVLGMIRNYLLLENGPEIEERKAQAARAEVTAELERRLRERPLEKIVPVRAWLVGRAAERLRYYFKLRENSRFYHIMALAVLRRKALVVEARLLHEGRLKGPDDVFFLRFAEMEGLLSGRLGWADVADRVRERRIEHVRLSRMGPPTTIGFELPRRADGPGPASVLLQGQGAAPGRFEGMARVILDPSLDVELRPGEILVAPYTDPAWTPLFLTAGAAVVEIGSYLSHAGTVAREFGMPCVVDAAEATRKIRTGDRIVVDGSRGTVERAALTPASGAA